MGCARSGLGSLRRDEGRTPKVGGLAAGLEGELGVVGNVLCKRSLVGVGPDDFALEPGATETRAQVFCRLAKLWSVNGELLPNQAV